MASKGVGADRTQKSPMRDGSPSLCSVSPRLAVNAAPYKDGALKFLYRDILIVVGRGEKRGRASPTLFSLPESNFAGADYFALAMAFTRR